MRGDTGRKDMSSEAHHYWRDSKGCKMFPAVWKTGSLSFVAGKKEALQYEGVECIREQVLYINIILNGYKSNVSKL